MSASQYFWAAQAVYTDFMFKLRGSKHSRYQPFTLLQDYGNYQYGWELSRLPCAN